MRISIEDQMVMNAIKRVKGLNKSFDDIQRTFRK